jgi:hypothetical protein
MSGITVPAVSELDLRAGSVVYFIQAANGLIKIGTTKDIRDRLYGLRNSSPVSLRLVGLIAADEAEEQALHRRFASFRAHGEWFAPAEELVLFVRRLVEAVAHGRDSLFSGRVTSNPDSPIESWVDWSGPAKKEREIWPGGYVRKDKRGRPVYLIERGVHGIRYHLSTRCHTLAAAMKQLERFEADPHNYTPSGKGKRAEVSP